MKTLLLVVALLATVTVRAEDVYSQYQCEECGYADDVDDPDAVTDVDAAQDGDTDTGYYHE